jgi:hypothetical protein
VVNIKSALRWRLFRLLRRVCQAKAFQLLLLELLSTGSDAGYFIG